MAQRFQRPECMRARAENQRSWRFYAMQQVDHSASSKVRERWTQPPKRCIRSYIKTKVRLHEACQTFGAGTLVTLHADIGDAPMTECQQMFSGDKDATLPISGYRRRRQTWMTTRILHYRDASKQCHGLIHNARRRRHDDSECSRLAQCKNVFVLCERVVFRYRKHHLHPFLQAALGKSLGCRREQLVLKLGQYQSD